MGVLISPWEGAILGKGSPTVKCRNFLPSAVQKWLKWLICHLGCGLGGPKKAQVQSYSSGGANVPTWEGTDTVKSLVVGLCVMIVNSANNCSAVAEMGDMAENWGVSPYLTQCGLGRGLPPYQVASWSIQPFNHNRHELKIGGARSPSNTMRPGLRPTSMPSFILIHHTVWLQLEPCAGTNIYPHPHPYP